MRKGPHWLEMAKGVQAKRRVKREQSPQFNGPRIGLGVSRDNCEAITLGDIERPGVGHLDWKSVRRSVKVESMRAVESASHVTLTITGTPP